MVNTKITLFAVIAGLLFTSWSQKFLKDAVIGCQGVTVWLLSYSDWLLMRFCSVAVLSWLVARFFYILQFLIGASQKSLRFLLKFYKFVIFLSSTENRLL